MFNNIDRGPHVIVGFSPSEGEAVATQAEESGETIARCFNSGEELMRGMGAAVLMTLGGMVVHSRNTGLRGLAHVERRTIATKYFHRRPFGQHRNGRRRVSGEFLRGVNDLSTHDREDGLDTFAIPLIFSPPSCISCHT